MVSVLAGRDLCLELGGVLPSKLLGCFSGVPRILVAHDHAAVSRDAAKVVSLTLTRLGSGAWSAGPLPFPVFVYSVSRLGYEAGIYIYYDGECVRLKSVGSNGLEVRLEEHGTSMAESIWSIGSSGVEGRSLEAYLSEILSRIDVDLISSMSPVVLLNTGGGVCGEALALLLSRMGVKFHTLDSLVDRHRPGRLSLDPGELSMTARVSLLLGANLGIFTDALCSSMIIIDDRGMIRWGDQVGALLAEYLYERMSLPARAYTPINSSAAAEEYLERIGIGVAWTKVDTLELYRRFHEEGGLLGFTREGHYVFPGHVPTGDAVLAASLMLEMLAARGENASMLFAELPEYHRVRTEIPVSRARALRIMEKLSNRYGDTRQLRLGGLRIWGGDHLVYAWFDTEKKRLVLAVEAKNPDKARRIAEEVRSTVIGDAA